MKYAFETLVSVSFYHDYFSDETFGGLAVEPSNQTSRVLLNNGLLLKPFNGGFRILYDTNFAGSTRGKEEVLKGTIRCRFILKLNDKEYYNYTEPAEGDINKTLYYFNNLSKDNTLKKSLHTDKYVSSEDLYPLDKFDEKYFVKPFGILDLTLSAGLQDSYSITFKAKETYWRYIFVGESLQSLNNPAIIDNAGSEFFDGPEKLPVRGKEAMAFRSKNPISFTRNTQKVFQLVDNYDAESGRYKVVMRALPSANPNHITLIDSDKNNQHLIYSEILIH
jgi:hypothetical protein